MFVFLLNGITVTTRVWYTEDPFAPYAVNIYVVVDVGYTAWEPEVFTVPIFEMLTETQLLVAQVRVEDWPKLIVLGFAL